jgi:hypothetical protein
MKDWFKNLSGQSRWQRCGCPTGLAEARQICLFRLAEEATAAFGCPTAFQQTAQIQFLPKRRAEQGEEPGETVAPASQPGAEAQQHIGQQSRPDLPAHGVGIVTQKVGQLQGLFEFLEEGFDAPTAAIEISDGLGAPREVIGQENHFPNFPVHLHQGHDAAQADWILFGRRAGQLNELIPQNVAELSILKFADDAKLQVVFGTGDPKDFALGQVGQVREVHISLVEDDDFTRMDIGAKFAGADTVMLGGRADEGAGGQETLEIKPDMTLGGGFAPPMFGPVQRTGHERNGGRVHDMNEALGETKSEAGRVVAGEGGLERLQMIQHGPEELLGHFWIAGAVGVRERVFAGRRGRAQGRERTGVQVQGVTHVIEAQGMGQLGVEQADDLTPRTERAGVVFDAGVARQFGHQVRRNEIAKLAQNRELAGGWLVVGFLFHALPCGKAQTRKPAFFYPATLNPLGQQ